MKTASHVLLFKVAGIVFVLGLGMQANPALGTLLWIVVATIAVLNSVWMSRSGR